jgi:hypothetical protein
MLISLLRAETSDVCKPNSKECNELKVVKKFVMKNVNMHLPISFTVELVTLFDSATNSLLDLPDNKKMHTLYSSAVADIAAAGNNATKEIPRRKTLPVLAVALRLHLSVRHSDL